MTNPSPLASAHLRIARPSDNLPAILQFYRDGLGFELLSQFTNHDGFDGIMLGHKNAPYHLEFTHKTGHAAGRAPSEDHLLVFYLSDSAQWSGAVKRLEALGHTPVKSFNPYWDKNGKTFADSDGYRVVLQNASWSS